MNTNTAAVRSVARRVNMEAERISAFTSSDLRVMKLLSQDSLLGLTADSIRNTLEALDGDASAIVSALYAVSETLMDYARRMDEADRQAQNLIQSR